MIYVGIDSSWRHSGALEWALRGAALRHEPLRAVYVVDETVRRAPYSEPTIVDHAAIDLVDEVQEHLDAGRGRLDNDANLMGGRPATTLVDAAAGSTMLVVGRRGTGAFKRLLIGSTSEEVVNVATVPVVVVPGGWKPGDHSGPVVVAVGESDADLGSIGFAVTAAMEREVPLRLVHAWDLPSVHSRDADAIARAEQEWDDNAQRWGEAIAGEWRLRYPELVIEVDVRRGHAVDGVITAAEQCDAQLLVVGGRRHHRTTAMLLGSVARGVLHHASCPVAVVHAEQN
ncbi:universal stress protein [Kribbella qitaiheensis]|uniref:universal stress protein n=1 Tax=Kribbella qitaiheensis TaxID=1544730 RepID=UPI003622D964